VATNGDSPGGAKTNGSTAIGMRETQEISTLTTQSEIDVIAAVPNDHRPRERDVLRRVVAIANDDDEIEPC
jgi:hypothetical protein